MIAAAFVLLAFQDRALLVRWRESIELDLPAEAIAEALPRVTGPGDLAQDGQAIALAARALAAAGEDARARGLLEASRPSEASRGFVEVARARLAIERDDLAGALKFLLAERAADPPVRFPAIAENWLLAGRALARGGDGARATPLLERFLALAPLDVEAPSAWHMLVQIAIERGDEKRAIELRPKALASAQWQAFYRTRRLQARGKPDEPLPKLGIVELFLAAGEPARAREVGRDLVLKFPGFCRGFEALARAERALGDLRAARGTLERGIACDPRARPMILELARVHSALGEGEAAAARYARYRELGGTEGLEER